MLIENLIYLFTPCSPMVKEMGYLRESVSIMSRYSRCKRDWFNHLRKSKATIENAIGQAPANGKVIIFGAGLGYDLPLTQLTSHFSQVLLVDLVHTLPIKAKALFYRNVELVVRDVTESLTNIYEGRDEIYEPRGFLEDKKVGLVISLNLLSQLASLPVSFLEKHHGISENEADLISQKIIQAHLTYLQKFDTNVCLVTDIERQVKGPDGEQIAKFSALHDVQVPWNGTTWLWNIAPLGEEDAEYSVTNKVLGISNITNASLTGVNG